MNKRVTVNSKELLLRESNGHASVAYNSISKHLARIRLNTISSEADLCTLPTLLYKALNTLKKRDLALSKLHLKVQYDFNFLSNLIQFPSVKTWLLYSSVLAVAS